MTITHFFTVDQDEATAAIANMGATSEGAPFWAFTEEIAVMIPMYRLREPVGGAQFLTTFIDEHDVAINEKNYQGDGIAFYGVPPDDTAMANIQPLFRMYNAGNNDHLYTIDPNEHPTGYVREGISCQVLILQVGTAIALQRFLGPGGRHYYAANQADLNLFQDDPDYTDEGPCGFVFTGPDGAPQRFYRSYNPATGGHFYTVSIGEHDDMCNFQGYRADGVSCFIFPDGKQPANAVKLLHAFNADLDDHLYTTDPVEFSRVTTKLNYGSQGFAGWVLSPEVGKASSPTAPVQRLIGDFTKDFLIPPPKPPASLSSNFNLFIGSVIGAGVNPIYDLEIDVDITSDLSVESVNFEDPGFSFQLNCFSPLFFTSSWQQYCLWLQGGSLNWEIQNWSKSPYARGFIVGSGTLCQIGGETLSAGHRLKISLLNDNFGNILGANFYVYKDTKQIAHKRGLIEDFPYGKAFGAAPVLSFQFVLVGPGDGATVTLVPGGGGLVTYQASVPLVASNQQVHNVESPFSGTAEQSNCAYGPVAETKSKFLTQTFDVLAGQPLSLARPAVGLRKLHHRPS